jgi:hypothetical protein
MRAFSLPSVRVAKRVQERNNRIVRRKPLWIVTGVLIGIAMLAALAAGAVAHGQAREAAMTSCSPTPSEVRKGAAGVVTVESRFLPWKFTCVFWSRSGHLIAKRDAPYEPPWPWR